MMNTTEKDYRDSKRNIYEIHVNSYRKNLEELLNMEDCTKIEQEMIRRRVREQYIKALFLNDEEYLDEIIMEDLWDLIDRRALYSSPYSEREKNLNILSFIDYVHDEVIEELSEEEKEYLTEIEDEEREREDLSYLHSRI